MLGFCSSPRFVEHDTGPHHPERPDRIRAIARAVRQAGLVRSPDPFPDFKIDLALKPLNLPPAIEIDPTPADEKWITLVHNPLMIEHIKHVCQIGGGPLDQGDTIVCPRSFDIALLGLGGVLNCCDAVIDRRVRQVFAAVRPPGHHAEPDRAMGFCLFSNIAIGARYLQRAHGVGKIAIVDFDVHHGNGTQAAFEDDPSVLFISLHQHPRTCYPGTGHEWETGAGKGHGFTLNIPFNPGAGDEDYLNVIDQRVVPEVDAFAPEILLISAGFDAHAQDPLADIRLSDEGFELMTRSLATLADARCGGRIVSVLEGGYNLLALGRSVVRHLVGMSVR